MALGGSDGDLHIVWEPGLREKLWDLAEPGLSEGASIVVAGMRRRIPRSTDGSHGRPSGFAASRLQVWRGRDVEGPYRDCGTDARTESGYPYPVGLEHGVKPHVIESTGPWPLRNPKTGQVFGRRVMHPGNKAMPWARPSLEDIRGRRL